MQSRPLRICVLTIALALGLTGALRAWTFAAPRALAAHDVAASRLVVGPLGRVAAAAVSCAWSARTRASDRGVPWRGRPSATRTPSALGPAAIRTAAP